MKSKIILAIPGSLRSGSSNHSILRHLATLVSDKTKYTIYNNLAQIPPFDPGLDNENPPTPVVYLRHLFSNANGIIICTPEYAFGVPGQLKNMLDWMVSSSSFVDKPVCLITASSNGTYAHNSLLLTLGALSANVIENATLLIPFIRSKIDVNGDVMNEDVLKSLQTAFDTFLKATN